ncbi:hypothetical protein MD484_g7959, partial [Candolleomyces efflorescens]
MKISLRLVTTLVSVALCGIVHAAPAPLCDRTSGLCGGIAGRDVADSLAVDDLVARAAKKKASSAKIQRQAALQVDSKVKAFAKQVNKTPASKAKVNAQANKLRQAEKRHVPTQARKLNKGDRRIAWASAAHRDTTTKNILAVQKHQGQKPKLKAKKKEKNNKVQQQAMAKITAEVKDWREKEKQAGGYVPRLNILADRLRVKKLANATRTAQVTRKMERGKKWAEAKKSPEQKRMTKEAAVQRKKERQRTGLSSPDNQAKLAKNVKLTKQEKQNVKDRFAAARQKYANTLGMPGRKQTATVGSNSANGREVKNSVFNSYLHQKNPLGNQRMPKPFNNAPYDATHGTLANKKPLPATAKNLKEYPVIKDSTNGWTGNSPVGALRTITYKSGGKRYAAVVGHDTDPARGGTPQDHYVAKITRNFQFDDSVDFE